MKDIKFQEFEGFTVVLNRHRDIFHSLFSSLMTNLPSFSRDRKIPERRGEGREVHRRRHQQEHETGPESFNTSQAVS